MTIAASGLRFVAPLCVAEALLYALPSAYSATTLDSDPVYGLTNVWTVHLKFEPDQWNAMEPKGGFTPFGGGPRGGGPGGGNAAKMLTPVFMSRGDLNRDGQLSQEEFVNLGLKWFKAWNTQGKGPKSMKARFGPVSIKSSCREAVSE